MAAMAPVPPSPYESIEAATVELRRLASENDWQAVARLADRLRATGPAKATANDRAAIEAALANIGEVEEKAEYLRNDLARLLKAFDKPA